MSGTRKTNGHLVTVKFFNKEYEVQINSYRGVKTAMGRLTVYQGVHGWFAESGLVRHYGTLESAQDAVDKLQERIQAHLQNKQTGPGVEA